MVSVVISFYERFRHLRACLDSLQLSPSGFDQVIIVDDGSGTETAEKVRNRLAFYDFPIEYVRQQHRGFRVAAARNKGIRHARGDYLIFFDCDFLILPGTVQAHVRAAKPGRFVAGSCKYLSQRESSDILSASITASRLEKAYQKIPDRELRIQHLRFVRRTLLLRLGLVPARKQSLGGHFSIHKKDIERVNGYDENFVGWGGEDEDLGIRLVRAGIYCRSAIRKARVLHVWHPKEIGDAHWKKGPNIDYFNRKDAPFFCKNGLTKIDGTTPKAPEGNNRHSRR